jgi:drug/metabolite transporter (DMT)-like permease
MVSMVQANQTNRAAPAIKAEAIAAHQTSAEPLPYPPPRAVESKSIYPPSRAREGRERAERIPLGIICVLAATILFAGSSALSKWLVGTYPIGEMLFVRAAAALVGSSLVILPATGLGVFRTKRLRDHMLRGISQSSAQTFLVIAFSLMPLVSAVAINFSAPLFATIAAVVFLKETVGPVRWGALIVGFLGILLVTSPGVDTLQAGSLFALANAILFGTVTVGVRSMTATESTETLIMYQMVFLTASFTAALPFGWVAPTLQHWGAMVVNGLGNALGQYLWTRALNLAPTSAVMPFNYFSLVWAIILGFLVWGDMPSAALLAGSAIVVGSGMFLLWHEIARAIGPGARSAPSYPPPLVGEGGHVAPGASNEKTCTTDVFRRSNASRSRACITAMKSKRLRGPSFA